MDSILNTFCKIVFFLCLFLLGNSYKAWGYWVEPIVRVEADDEYSFSGASVLAESLEESLTELIRGFSPQLDVRKPLHPMEFRLTLDLKEQRGSTIVTDVLLRAYRPIYGKEESTILLQILVQDIEIEKDMHTYDTWKVENAQSSSNIFVYCLYYYLHLSFALYYDSFGENGGEPFWNSLESISSMTTFSDSSLPFQRYAYSPKEVIPLLHRPLMDFFRESWREYHREILDNVYRHPLHFSDRLVAFAQKLLLLRQENPAYSFFRLFLDVKSKEFLEFYQSFPDADKRKAYPTFLKLFPSLASV